MINTYYQILGLQGGASIDEVKQAYRRKAKACHPDINRAENAEAEFILINEAYEMILQSLSKKLNQSKIISESEWRAAARKRAAYYARKSYQDFRKSKNYRSAIAIFNFFDIIFFFTGTLIMLIPIVFADFSNLDLEPAIAMGLLMVISFFFGLALAFLSIKSIFERWQKNHK